MSYWTTDIKVITKNNAIAKNALDIMKDRLNKGFGVDGNYKRTPSSRLAESLEVKRCRVITPEDDGFYLPEDAMKVIPELLQYLAERLGADFKLKSYHQSEYDECSIDANYHEGVLDIETVYYPSGYCEELCCEECGEVVIEMEDY